MVIARCTKGESYCARHHPKPCPPSFERMRGDGNYWCACVQCDEPFWGGKYAVQCPDCKALAIEAATAGETTKIGSTEGESAGPKDNAQNMSGPSHE